LKERGGGGGGGGRGPGGRCGQNGQGCPKLGGGANPRVFAGAFFPGGWVGPKQGRGFSIFILSEGGKKKKNKAGAGLRSAGAVRPFWGLA